MGRLEAVDTRLTGARSHRKVFGPGALDALNSGTTRFNANARNPDRDGEIDKELALWASQNIAALLSAK